MNVAEPHNRKLLLNDEAPFITSSPLRSPPLITTTTNNSNSSTHIKPIRHGFFFDYSMALTILVLLTALFFMGFFSIYIARFTNDNAVELNRRRRRQHRTSSRAAGTAHPHGLDPVAVRSLPLFAYDLDTKQPLDCVVCLGEFQDRETVKMIPYCRHVFHPPCIDTWLSSHDSCPLCRSTKFFNPNHTCLRISDQGGFDDDDGGGGGCDLGVSGFRLRSTEGSEDTSVERESEVISCGGTRRTSSCCSSSLGERASLQRSSSL